MSTMGTDSEAVAIYEDATGNPTEKFLLEILLGPCVSLQQAKEAARKRLPPDGRVLCGIRYMGRLHGPY
jgi:hypothetical protein